MADGGFAIFRYPRAMRRATTTLLAMGLAAGTIVGVPGATMAYPPGTKPVVSASPNPVSVGAQVTAAARRLQPNCPKVTFTFGGASQTTSANGAGQAVVLVRAQRTGNRTLKVKGCGETASTTVQVRKPIVNAPNSSPARTRFTTTFKGFTRGTVTVSFVRNNTIKSRVGSANNNGSGKVSVNLRKRATWSVIAIQGALRATDSIRIR